MNNNNIALTANSNLPLISIPNNNANPPSTQYGLDPYSGTQMGGYVGPPQQKVIPPPFSMGTKVTTVGSILPSTASTVIPTVASVVLKPPSVSESKVEREILKGFLKTFPYDSDSHVIDDVGESPYWFFN